MAGEILGYRPDTILPTPGWLARTIKDFGLTDRELEGEVDWQGKVVNISAAWVWDHAEVRTSSSTGKPELFLIQETDQEIVWQQNPSLDPATYIAALRKSVVPFDGCSGLVASEYPLRRIGDIDLENSRLESPSIRQQGLPREPLDRLMIMKEIVEQAFSARVKSS